MTTKIRARSKERTQFLADILITALEHCGYGWFTTQVCRRDGGLDTLYAEITHFEGDQYRIDLDTVAKGLGVIRRAVMRVDKDFPSDGEVLHNSKTGQRLYISPSLRRDLLAADRTNGERGDYDVIGALAVVECALFGQRVYG